MTFKLTEQQLKVFNFISCLILCLMFSTAIYLMCYVTNSLNPILCAIGGCFMLNWICYKDNIRVVDSETGFILWEKRL